MSHFASDSEPTSNRRTDMPLRNCLVLVLVVIVVTGRPTALAQRAVGATELQEQVQRLVPGVLVLVRLKDGSRIEGTLLKISGEALSVQPRTRMAVPPRELQLAGI